MTDNDIRLSGFLKSLGPGLLWAGAAIGVSHLVQSTRAGASYGFLLVWAVLVANLFKYPFFEYGPRYAAATGETLLEGYLRLGRWAMGIYLLFTFAMMFTITAAVTVVTAGLAERIFGFGINPVNWSAILFVICALFLLFGRYPLLDKMIKVIIVLLTLSTLTAVIIAISHGSSAQPGFHPPAVWDLAGISFLVALMGWMPSAFDISVWHSVWTIERKKQTGHAPKLKEALFDFNLGYIGTAFLALVFLTLGALTMYGTGESFSESGSVFAGQLINMYTQNLGSWSYWIILLAAFTTMFSTTLTVIDAFPRVLRKATELVLPAFTQRVHNRGLYFGWMLIVCSGALVLLGVLPDSMKFMVDLATTLSFILAPVLGYINYRVVTGKHMPEEARPPAWLRILSWLGLVFLTGFSLLFLAWKFGLMA